MLRQLEQERLNKETEARELAEAKQRQYEQELAQMRENMQMKEREIERAHDQIRELEQQLIELSKAKEELQNKEEELVELNRQLRSERALSEEERSRLVHEIGQREVQVAQMRSLVESKTQETNQLQREVNQSHHFQQNNHHQHHHVAEHNGSDDYTNVNVGKHHSP